MISKEWSARKAVKPKVLSYTIQGRLATLAEHDNANRTNRYGGAALKKEMTELVAWQIKSKEKIVAPCTITFHWHYSGKHDFDNIRFAAKYVLDGMVHGGVLVDDSPKYVLGFGGDYFVKVDKGADKVVVEAELYD